MTSSHGIQHWLPPRLIQAVIVLLPTYLTRFTIVGLPINALDVICLIVFGIVIVLRKPKQLPIVWRSLVASFIIIGGLAVITSANTTAALGMYKSLIIIPALVGLATWLAKPTIHHIIQAITALSVFIASIGIVQWITGWGIPAPWNEAGSNFRITSVFEFPNAVGLILAPLTAMLVAFVISLAVNKRLSGKHWPVGLAIVLNCLAIPGARADGAIVAVAASTIITLFIATYHKRAVWKWSIASSVLLGGSIAVLWQPTREIIFFQDTSGEVRLAVWQGTWNLLKDNMLLGAGLAGFPELYAEYKLARHVELLLYPHNIFFNFWVQLGLAGIVWLAVTISILLRTLIQQLRSAITPTVLIGVGYLTSMLVYGLVDVPYFKNDLAVLFWIVLAFVMVSKNYSKSSSLQKG